MLYVILSLLLIAKQQIVKIQAPLDTHKDQCIHQLSQSQKKRSKFIEWANYKILGSVICIYPCCFLYNQQVEQKFIMKIEQRDSGVIFAQNGVEKNIKSRRLLKEIFEKQSDFKFYGWGFQENYTYITYLKYFKNIFDSPEARKRAKVFTHISKLLITRTSNQIKCHHQKMMNRHKSIDGIIEYLRLKIIKYLKHHSEAISEIEKINVNCEKFFIRQSGFEDRVQESLQHKKLMDLQKPQKEVKKTKSTVVKRQDSAEEYEYGELKNSQFLDGTLKIEEPQSESEKN